MGSATFAQFWPLDKAESAEHADPSRLIFKLCMLYNCRCTQKKEPHFRHFFGLPEVAGVVRHRKIESIYERLKQHLRDGNSGIRMALGTGLVGYRVIPSHTSGFYPCSKQSTISI